MYIFLNHDVFPQIKSLSKRRKNAGTNEGAILKEAKRCARKFSKDNQQMNNNKFVHYCCKRVDKLIVNTKTEEVDFESIENMVSLFDNFCYKNGLSQIKDININKDFSIQSIQENDATFMDQEKMMEDKSNKNEAQVRNSQEQFQHHEDQISKDVSSAGCHKCEADHNEIIQFDEMKRTSKKIQFVDEETPILKGIPLLGGFDYHAADGSNYEVIQQLDGSNDVESDYNKQVIEKRVFAINCEVKEISDLINFFRSWDFLWSFLPNHTLCNVDQKQPDTN